MLRRAACGLALFAAACGSSGGGPSGTPTPAASPTPLGPPVATITPSGMQPQVLHTFDARESITFVNADGRAHDLRSDPHPAHTECPALSVDLQPGERQEITGPSLPRFTLCFYHDEADPTDDRFRGVVVTH